MSEQSRTTRRLDEGAGAPWRPTWHLWSSTTDAVRGAAPPACTQPTGRPSTACRTAWRSCSAPNGLARNADPATIGLLITSRST